MRAGAAVAVVLALVVTGCGGDDETETVTVQEETTETTGESSAGTGPEVTTDTGPTPEDGLSGEPIAGSNATYKGARLRILKLERSGPGTVTLEFAMVNEGEDFFNEHDFKDLDFADGSTDDVGGTYLLDEENGKRYLVLRDSQEECVCSQSVQAIDPGESASYFAKFPAPPEDVTEISVVVPNWPAVDAVPIADEE